jgi:hypothetical protein
VDLAIWRFESAQPPHMICPHLLVWLGYEVLSLVTGVQIRTDTICPHGVAWLTRQVFNLKITGPNPVGDANFGPRSVTDSTQHFECCSEGAIPSEGAM